MIEKPYEESEIVKREVVYTRPTLFRRVMANLIDLIVFLITTFLLLLAARAIVNRTPAHLAQLELVNGTRLDSCLYVRSGSQIVTTSSFLENSGIPTSVGKQKAARNYLEGIHDSEKDITGFIPFCRMPEYGNENLYTTVLDEYDKFRLNTAYVYKDEPYFIRLEPTTEYPKGQVVENPSCTVEKINYYNIYRSFMINYCEGVLASAFPSYKAALRSFAIDLFAIELPISYALAGILVYFVPTVIFWRGHKTLGKLAYRIGVVNQDLLNISFGKNLARFAIFYFSILILSLATFAAPVIISFSMMVFTKNKQGFQDYMLNLYEVDTTGYKIYVDLEEAAIDQLNTAKTPVNFKRVEKE